MPVGRDVMGRTGRALAAVGLLVAGALAQVPEPSPAPQTHRETPGWRFVDSEIELATLVEIAARTLKTRIEFDATQLVGRVSLDRVGEYPAREIWALVNRELQSRSLASVQPPGATGLRIVPVADAAPLARLEAFDLAEAQAGYVKVLVTLERRKADELVETVKLLLSKSGGAVTAVRDGNALLISDYNPHVEQALDVLSLLDLPSGQALIEEIALDHLSPVAMGALLERVTQTRETVSGNALRGAALPLTEGASVLIVAPTDEIAWWRETVARFDRPEPVTTLHYTPRRFGLEETAKLIEETVHADAASDPVGSWRMVQGQLTGTLVITATPGKHAAVQALFDRLETIEAGPIKPVKSFAIKHRRVSEVLDLLEKLLDAGVLQNAAEAQESASTSTTPATVIPTAKAPTRPGPARVSTAHGELGGITLAADEPASRILAFGEARLLDQLGSLIATLDVPQKQVLVETLVVSLNDTQTRQLGVELQGLVTSGSTSARLSSLFGLGSPDPAGALLPPTTLAGGSAVVLDPGDFSAVVNVLETLNEGRTLTIPKVLVANNTEATLDSTLQTPYASTNASTTVATTSFGGTLDAGTSISVKPQVADGDRIVIEYTISLSSFVGSAADPALPPPRQENRLQSVVSVPDNFAIAVGGLEVETEGDQSSQVPLLGDLPLLGVLFRDQSKTKSKSRFFVFLRCSVMQHASFEDLKYSSRAPLEEAGLDDGWPVLEPRVMR